MIRLVVNRSMPWHRRSRSFLAARPRSCRSFLVGLPVALTLAIAGFTPLDAQRRPVLPQIAVPHSYYYREMYLPQLTSGPSAAAWSPDGTELIYSMQGYLWRQRLTGTEAAQLTDDDAYDYQPDWSSDGRWVVYASYRNDAIELRVLDLRSGHSRTLLANGAVNLEPRFSPDGRRLAWVSTAFEGRWHVFVADFTDGALSQPTRITPDVDSKLPRYYYSRWDHYLSPTWSPDGQELILVSNRGRIWGTGGFWRMAARPDAEPRLIWYEETTWKARPDWSPDGRRVVYSSYLGRQWNQLWLMTSDGGDPLQLTYGDFDNTAPRWSPDGRRIVYVTNQDGNLALRLITVPGGEITPVEPGVLRWIRPRRHVTISVGDSLGSATPARVSVTAIGGRGFGPRDAWIHADDGFDRSQRRYELTYFVADGRSELDLPEGRYLVEASKGYEYVRHVDTVTVGAFPIRLDLRLTRLADLPARGWWSGDLHVHMNYGGTYRNTPAHLLLQAEAEDLHVVENLVVNKEARIPDIAYWSGRIDPTSTPSTILKHDEEYHTSYWGHTGHLGLTRYFIQPNYAGYVNTAAASLAPTNADIMDLAHGQGGVSGYVHPFESVPDPGSSEPLTDEFPVDVALGKVDYLEVVGFSDHFSTAEVWYRLLNTGIRLPTGAGTDAMANFASLRGPVGLARVFVKSGLTLDYRDWLDGLKAGRTFATNGPLLGFRFGDVEPGDSLNLGSSSQSLTATVWMRSTVAVDSLQIVSNGQVVRSIGLDGGGTRADAQVAIPVTRSGWYTLRAFARHSQYPTLDLYPFATTSPIYVTVGGRPIRSAEDARYFVAWIDRLEQAALAHPGWNTAAERDRVLAQLRQARARFEALGREAR